MHTVSCFIYRIEEPRVPEGKREAQSSEILKAWHEEADQSWRRRYGWVPIHYETMIGKGVAKNLGACFRRAGYRSLGWTTGRTARRPAGNTHGPRVWSDSTPKLVLYRGPLARLPQLTQSSGPAPPV